MFIVPLIKMIKKN